MKFKALVLRGYSFETSGGTDTMSRSVGRGRGDTGEGHTGKGEGHQDAADVLEQGEEHCREGMRG